VCLATLQCSNLVRQAFPTKELLLCQQCKTFFNIRAEHADTQNSFIPSVQASRFQKKPSGLINKTSLISVISKRAKLLYRNKSAILDPWSTVEDWITCLVKNHVDESNPNVWKDGYNGTLSMTSATYPPEWFVSGHVKHPFKPSVKKPYPRVMREDGKIALHDPTNITLTKHCINLIKGYHGPASIPILKCYY